LEVPGTCLTATGTTTDTIGAWSIIRQLIHQGALHVPGKQVSRLANPLINELVIGVNDKFLFNSADPQNDGTNFVNYILFPSFPEIINVLFGATVNSVLGTSFTTIAPATPRLDLGIAFGTGIPGVNALGPGLGSPAEYMRLNLSTAPVARANQNPLGVIAGDAAGMPNGRRPGDDAVDVVLQVVVAGKLCQLFIGCNASAGATVAPIAGVKLYDGTPISANDFQNVFPYLNSPIPGALNAGRNTNSSPSSGLSLPSFVAIFVALAAGFLISFGFFR